jgi:hypothetical protein
VLEHQRVGLIVETVRLDHLYLDVSVLRHRRVA